jgi:hypothetical protein
MGWEFGPVPVNKLRELSGEVADQLLRAREGAVSAVTSTRVFVQSWCDRLDEGEAFVLLRCAGTLFGSSRYLDLLDGIGALAQRF